MVSTTLTTSAAEQQHTTTSATLCDSSAATLATSVVAGSSNYQDSLQPHHQHFHSSALSSSRNQYYSPDSSTVNGVSSSNFAKAYAKPIFEEESNSNHRDNNFRKDPATALTYLHNVKYLGSKHQQQQQQQQLQQQNSNTAALSALTAECLSAKPDLIETTTQTSAPTKLTRYEAVTAAAPKSATPGANLTQKPKHAASPPPAPTDQISLLFPKCRPKYVSSNNNNNNNNNNTTNHSLPHNAGNDIVAAEESKISSELERNTLHAAHDDDSFMSSAPSVPLPANRSSPTNYHRTVNLITQSPPPHSTSSLSSESLSSVTPRISTNPFLYPNLSSNSGANIGDPSPTTGHKPDDRLLNEPQLRHSADDEELPIPAIETFYYQTSTIDDRRGERRQHAAANNSYDMPRKRFSYSGYQRPQSSAEHYTPFAQSSAVIAVDVHQQQVQQQPMKLYNGSDETKPKQHLRAPSSNNQNPFMRNNVWETLHNGAGGSVSNDLNLTEYSSTEKDLHVVPRRSYHPQTSHCNSTNVSSSTGRQQQQQQHYIRVSHSPLRFGEQFETSRRAGERFSHKSGAEALVDVAAKWNPAEHSGPEGGESKPQKVGLLEKEHDRLPHECDIRSREQELDIISDRRLSVIADGEVVVFDDIAESWQNLRVTTDPSSELLTTGVAKRPPSNFTTTPETLQQQQQQLIYVPCSTKEMLLSSKAGKLELSNNCGDIEATAKSALLKEHKRGSYAISVETRHGIIEYEGSPRRIGQGFGGGGGGGGFSAPDVSLQPVVQSPDTAAAVTSTTSLTSNSPQQQYRARPGFPQRIHTSPPRVASPSVALLSAQSQPQEEQQQQQQPSAANDNNAEDTSNDVSEIGTISDMTAPETTPTAAPPPNATPFLGDDTAAVTTTTTATLSSTINVTNNNNNNQTTTAFSHLPAKSTTFDYLYEFSETRKVLEEFFKCPSSDERPIENGSDVDSIDIQYEFQTNLQPDDDKAHEDGATDATDDQDDDDDDEDEEDDEQEVEEVEELATQEQTHFQLKQSNDQQAPPAHRKYLHQQRHNHTSHQRRHFTNSPLMRDFDFFLESASRSSGEQTDPDGVNHNQLEVKKNYRYSPETTDYDSNCDLDSLSGELNGGISTSCSNYTKYYTSSMPVLEDGLSSGHTSDTENNNNNNNNNLQQAAAITVQHTPIGVGGISVVMDMKCISTSYSLSGENTATATSTTTIAESAAVATAAATTTLETDGINSMELTKISSNSPTNAGLRRNEGPLTSLTDDAADNVVAPPKMDSNEPDRQRECLEQSPGNDSNSNSNSNKVFKNIDPDLDSLYSISVFPRPDVAQMTPPPPAPAPHRKPNTETEILQPIPFKGSLHSTTTATTTNATLCGSTTNCSVASIAAGCTTYQRPKSSQCVNNVQQMPTTRPIHSQKSPPPIPERSGLAAISDISVSSELNSPIWVPRQLGEAGSSRKSLLEPPEPSPNLAKNLSADEEEVDTDLETDRLLGHQRLDDQGYYDENKSWESRKSRSSLLSKFSPKQQHTKTRNGYNALLSTTPEMPPPVPPKSGTKKLLDIGSSMSSPEHSEEKSPGKLSSLSLAEGQECDSHVATTIGSPAGSQASACGSVKNDTCGGGNTTQTHNSSAQNGGASTSSAGSNNTNGEKKVKKSGAVLIEGVLFRARYLGSTQLVCEGQPTKSTRMMQAEEAVSRIKALAPDGDVQPSTEVDLFISTEKIMVLNTDLKEIMMDHALRTISYIADIGDLVVLMARRRFVPQDIDDAPKPNRTPKMICHVFESDEAQFIAQSIGQAFQVAYMEFLKANGIEDHSFVKEMDYQEVLNSQEIFGDELEIFAKKELQKEVVVPKAKGEILGVVIVESGWGSMLPTVVIANLMSTGAAARCGQLNIGDQLIAINGLSLVGLPLSTCQTYIKNTKNQTVVKFTVVPCAPVVEVKIKRPNTKYQLGFSVQNGVICSLLRGGIAERGGVRVGHRIIEINNQSVVAVPHEKIVNLLATSVGEILMKTMPTSMFRLLTGQENPIYI